MKGKFRILRNIGLGVLLVCALMLAFMPVAPVSADATAVTNVYVEFPFTDASNDNSDSDFTNVYIIHFKATTAMKRGVDYVTVAFPDGSEAMGGDGDTGGNYVFSVSSTALDQTDVLFSTDYDTTEVLIGATWTGTTTDPIVGGTRAKCMVPIDIAADTDVWVKFEDNSGGNAITSAATEADTYRVYVSTTKDTTPVLSSKFAIGESTVTDGSTAMHSSYPVPTTAGSTAEYILDFTPTAKVTGTSGKVTVKFPVGTVLPTSITATNVLFNTGGGSYSPCSETPVVDTDRRMITAIPSTDLTAGAAATMKILAAAGITNPKRAADTSDASTHTFMVRTSADGQWNVSDAYEITFGTGNKVMVGDGEIGKADTIGSGGYYSDNATMINMYSSQIYVVLADANGNGITPSSDTTLNISSSSATGTFATNAAYAGTDAFTTGVTSTTIGTTNSYDPCLSDGITTQIFYYKDSTAGTHTLTFKASGYADATWDITVCPGVSVYDASDNLIHTYAPLSTQSISETAATSYTQKYSVDYITDAISAAIAGDTVKLGDGTYELDTYINLNKKVTLTSVNGASSTSLRPVSEDMGTQWLTTADLALLVGVSGTSANPVIIDGLTFTRLRSGTEFDMAIFNAAYNYVTVRNCVFNYIIPDYLPSGYTYTPADDERGSVVGFLSYTQLAGGADAALTSATISNNTFTNCCSFGFESDWCEQPACINVFIKAGGTAYAMSGVTVSGNTLTNCNGIGIAMKGLCNADGTTFKGDVTDNTLTNSVYPISIQGYTDGVNVLRNTVTGGYMTGLWVEFSDHDSLVIKNNTFTGCAGNGGTSMDYSGVIVLVNDAGATGTDPVIQYNDISNNDATYSIYVATSGLGAQDFKYNYYGDASGPAYTAVTGATVAKSNPNGTGAQISDQVTYYPWLHKPLTEVVADNVSWQTSTMKLVAGWNTLSTPVPLISAADTVQELIPSGMTIGYYYDGGWTQITTAYTLSPCDAVYVKMSEAKYVQLKFECKTFSTPSKDLAVGWNLISMAAFDSDGKKDKQVVASVYKTAANLPGYSLVISPSLNATRYDMYYNTDTAGWAYSVDETTGDGTNTMYAGMGYWIYMQNAATLAGFEITPIAPDLD